MRVCRSPWLIAAYHGLHRLCVPRHPPHAIARLTTKMVSLELDPLSRHSPSQSCIPSRARAINRVQSRSIVSLFQPVCSRVSTQNSDKSLYQLFACSCDSSIPRSTIRFCCQIALTQTPPELSLWGGGVELRKIELGCDVRVKRLQEFFSRHGPRPTQNPLRR